MPVTPNIEEARVAADPVPANAPATGRKRRPRLLSLFQAAVDYVIANAMRSQKDDAAQNKSIWRRGQDG